MSPTHLAVAHYRTLDSQVHTLRQHLRGTGILTRRFARKIGLSNLGELMGLLHDLGKYGIAFQTYLMSALGIRDPDLDADDSPRANKVRGGVDHSTAGAQWIWKLLSSSGNPELTFAGQWMALCIASHHSGLIDCLTPDGVDRFSERMRKADADTHLEEAWSKADADVRQRIERLAQSPALKIEILQLIHRIQGVGTPGKDGFLARRMRLGLAARFAFSCLIAGDRIDTAHFSDPAGVRWRQGGPYHHWPKLVDRLERHLAAFPCRSPIDSIRQSISTACFEAAARPAGIYTLSVPTGGGKTLASLRFALHHAATHRRDRIIYVTPFTSIIEQNAEVVRQVLETDGQVRHGRRIVLEHHSNLGAERQTYADKLLHEDWDAPVVFTTMVQFLEALFGTGTRGVRRLHQLANAVLVFDEIQTLPIRCVHLFNHAINFLVQEGGSTVVLCTATQPLLHRVDEKKGALALAFQAELMPDADGLFGSLRRVQVCDLRRDGGWDNSAIAGLAVEAVETQGNCLVIVNTKRAARDLFQHLAARRGKEGVFHLSTDMCPAHRRQVLRNVKERLRRGLQVACVSTQLIEAGVDVDFRVVVRFLAGLDSIAQAAGRCNRNGRPEPGLVYIVNPAEENLAMLPDVAEGRIHAGAILDRFRLDPARYNHDCLGRQAMAEYYEHYFFQRQHDMDYPLPRAAFYGASLLELLSDQKGACETYQRQQQRAYPHELRQAFQTAAREFRSIDTQTDSVIVPYAEEGKALVLDFFAQFERHHMGPRDPAVAAMLMRQAQGYTVNVYPHILRRLKERSALTLLGGSSLYCLNVDFYDADFGLAIEAVNSREVFIWDNL
ncbi:CRISPR-associated helicase Cas3' [Parapusillimonas granuli]|uniref:CRISPR-associated helicase Cas3 n=2 Tax=Parapusillimonas granuli TaxID=380911 RepID=A0A853GAM4_9BURK|nr:CRISPR-associated helicase Cas3' [Parapusillimonas granuli]